MDSRELKKVHAAAVHLREVADNARDAVGRAEEKAERFRALLVEAEAGIGAAQRAADETEQAATQAEALSAECSGNVYANAGTAGASVATSGIGG